MRLVCSPTSPEALLQMQAGAYLVGILIVKRNNVSDMKSTRQNINVELSGAERFLSIWTYAIYTISDEMRPQRLKFYLVGNSNSKGKIG
jgi:hypothetical protein